MNYRTYHPLMRESQHDQRFFPLLPFVAGLAVGPLLFGGYGQNNYYGPNYGPQFGPNFGPQFGPNYGPNVGYGYGPNYYHNYGPYYRQDQ